MPDTTDASASSMLAASSTPTPSSAPAPTPWRMELLLIDETPDRHAALYLAWRELGAAIEIETRFDHAFQRMRLGRYSLVVLPLSGLGQFSTSDQFVADLMDRWAVAYADNYVGRFVYYGPSDVVDATVPQDRPRTALPPIIRLNPFPTAHEIARATDTLNTAARTIGTRRKTILAAVRGTQPPPASTTP